MALSEGEASNILGDEHFSQEVGRLPFSIQADNFQVEHYPARPWMLVADVPWPPGQRAAEGEPYAQVSVDWKTGAAVRIPLTHDDVTVLQYLPSARATFAGGAAATVEVAAPGGVLKECPQRWGRA